MILWKEFTSKKFLLDWRKIVLLVILFTVSSMNQSRCAPGFYDLPGCGFNGFPLVYLEHDAIGYTPVTNIDYLSLAGDLVFWFLFSAFIVWTYDMKIRKGKKKAYWNRSGKRENTT